MRKDSWAHTRSQPGFGDRAPTSGTQSSPGNPSVVRVPRAGVHHRWYRMTYPATEGQAVPARDLQRQEEASDTVKDVVITDRRSRKIKALRPSQPDKTSSKHTADEEESTPLPGAQQALQRYGLSSLRC